MPAFAKTVSDALPVFDRKAVLAHASMLHGLAERAQVDGVLIVAGFEEDPRTGRKGTPRVEQFRIGDVAGMVDAVMACENIPHLNTYAPWAIFKKTLPLRHKGSEDDVVAFLAVVADQDSDTGKAGSLPVEPPYVLETSPGNFQDFFPLSRPLSRSEAKPLVVAFADAIGCDFGTKDLSHLWRISGSVNWPTKRKLERGRSPIPHLVTVRTPWSGVLIAPELLASVSPRKSSGAASGAANAGTERPVAELLKACDPALRGDITRAAMTGEDRSATAFAVILRLIGKGFSDSEIVALFAAHEHGIGARYAEGKDLAGDLRRARGKSAFEETPNDTGPAPDWPEPQPLPKGLLPVAPFSTDFLPFTLSVWVEDIGERMQCPAEFIAVTAMAALGAVLGRRIGVRPQQHTDWAEVASFWACDIGRPGWLKSPAMGEALKPLLRLESEAQVQNEKARRSYEQELELWKLKKTARERAALGELKKDRTARPSLSEEKPEEPLAKRYITNDASYEALGQLLVANPTGILLFRDELVSLLKTLDREEYAQARGFIMTAWGGMSAYSFDRIIRGHQHIQAAFVGLVGSTQPGRIAEYLRRATSTSEGNDGLVQRFSLLVWPDASPHWRDSDEFPNTKAREAAWEVFERFSKLDLLAVQAQSDAFDSLPYLRFDAGAQGLFHEWRAGFEARIRSGELPEALEGHLAKYRKLVPTLALVNHLADGGGGPIPHDALRRALAFAGYLETHARRAYAAAAGSEADTARLILAHIRSGDLKDGFRARDIRRHGWSGLTDHERVGKGLELLVDFDWIAPRAVGKNPAGGRPTVLYNINPRGRS